MKTTRAIVSAARRAAFRLAPAWSALAILSSAAPAQAPREASAEKARGASAAPTATESAAGTSDSRASGAIEWNARTAEHLLNRAGLGARPEEIELAVAQGLERTVERLLDVHADRDPYFVERNAPDYRSLRNATPQEEQQAKAAVRQKERRQVDGYLSWWFERLLSGDEPLKERMVLFWHGFFTSSPMGVRRSYELLRQNQLVREHALGSYADLLRAMVRDPALLMYLDNHVNKKESPNENFARELMELFALGEGNYSERDVKEAARALTGRASDGDGQYVFRKRQHDEGEKTILGVSGKLDGDDLVDILLKQDACPRWVARRLLAYFEGVEPAPERLERFAQLLRAEDFQIKPFLQALFLDPAFYRPEVLGARFASPIDYLVGSARRLGVRPPGPLLHAATAVLGQKLLNPPNVKGWEEGPAWITTASLIARGNYAGLMLGVISPEEVGSDEDWLHGELEMAAAEREGRMSGEDEPSMGGDGAMSGEEPAMRGDEPSMGGDEPSMGGEEPSMGGEEAPSSDEPAMSGAGRGPARARGAGEPAMQPGAREGRAALPAEFRAWARVADATWRAGLNLSARVERGRARTDAQIVELLLGDLLAIEVAPSTREQVLGYFRAERTQLGLKEGRLRALGSQGDAVEGLLRRTAHLILSLPEAQLL